MPRPRKSPKKSPRRLAGGSGEKRSRKMRMCEERLKLYEDMRRKIIEASKKMQEALVFSKYDEVDLGDDGGFDLNHRLWLKYHSILESIDEFSLGDIDAAIEKERACLKEDA